MQYGITVQTCVCLLVTLLGAKSVGPLGEGVPAGLGSWGGWRGCMGVEGAAWGLLYTGRPCVRPPHLCTLSVFSVRGRIGPVGAPVRAVRITSRESGVALMVNRGGFRGHKYWAGRGKIL